MSSAAEFADQQYSHSFPLSILSAAGNTATLALHSQAHDEADFLNKIRQREEPLPQLHIPTTKKPSARCRLLLLRKTSISCKDAAREYVLEHVIYPNQNAPDISLVKCVKQMPEAGKKQKSLKFAAKNNLPK
jgi:hypothetical protein